MVFGVGFVDRVGVLWERRDVDLFGDAVVITDHEQLMLAQSIEASVDLLGKDFKGHGLLSGVEKILQQVLGATLFGRLEPRARGYQQGHFR